MKFVASLSVVDSLPHMISSVVSFCAVYADQISFEGDNEVPLMGPGMPLSTSKRRDIGFVPAANFHRLSHFGIWSYVLLRGMGFALTVQIVVPPLC